MKILRAFHLSVLSLFYLASAYLMSSSYRANKEVEVQEAQQQLETEPPCGQNLETLDTNQSVKCHIL